MLRCIVIGAFAGQFLYYVPLYRHTQHYATINCSIKTPFLELISEVRENKLKYIMFKDHEIKLLTPYQLNSTSNYLQ